jgi:hypothetical protein
LAGVWVLLLIAIPGLLNTWFNYKYPSTNKTEIAEYRDYDFKAWDKPNGEHKKFLYAIYPALQKDTAKIDNNKIRSFSYSLQVFNREKELYEQITKQKQEQVNGEENTFWVNPVGGIMRSFATISQTSLTQQQQFEQAVLAYRLKKLKQINENQVFQTHFTKKDFEAMPKFSATNNNLSVTKYLLPVFLFAVLALLGIIFIKRTSEK